MAADEIVALLKAPVIPGTEAERAKLLSNLGMVQDKLGRYADAENTLEKARQIWNWRLNHENSCASEWPLTSLTAFGPDGDIDSQR